jgi:hypothetical protein
MNKLQDLERGHFFLLFLLSSIMARLASCTANGIRVLPVQAGTGSPLLIPSSSRNCRRGIYPKLFQNVHFTSVKASAKSTVDPSAKSSRVTRTTKVVGSDGTNDDGETEEEEEEFGYDSLNPLGKTIAGAVEVGVITASSYISGGVLGYLVGGAMGVPILFRPPPSAGGNTNNALKQLASKLKLMNEKAVQAGKNWGQLSASFSGFHALCRAVRGGREDKWNYIIGSGAAGAFQSRSGMFSFCK